MEGSPTRASLRTIGGNLLENCPYYLDLMRQQGSVACEMWHENWTDQRHNTRERLRDERERAYVFLLPFVVRLLKYP